MSLEVFGDEDPDYGWSDEQVYDCLVVLFRTGCQMMREMQARFVEQGGDATTAGSIRANWNQSWGDDPGRPSEDDYQRAAHFFDPMGWTP